MTSSLTQQQTPTQFLFNPSSTKFLSLDIDQSNTVYSLYAASAAAAAAAAAAAGPFPSLFGTAAAVPRIALQPFNHSSQLLVNNKSELAFKNLLSPVTTIPQNNNMISISTAQDIICKNDGISSAFTPCIVNSGRITSVPVNTSLPKSNVVKIVKSDYFNSNQQLVSSSTINDSDGNSSSGSSDTFSVESRISPATVLAAPAYQKTSCQVKVIVSGESLPPVATISGTSATYCDSSLISGLYDSNVIASSSSPSSPSSINASVKMKGCDGISSKKRKELIRDDAYWERRRKNNDAAKRSRDSRRKKEDEVAIRAAILEQENLRLHFEIDRLKSEIERYRLVTSINNNNNNNNNENNNNQKNFNKSLQQKKLTAAANATAAAVVAAANFAVKSDNNKTVELLQQQQQDLLLHQRRQRIIDELQT